MRSELDEQKKSIITVCRQLVHLGLTLGTWGNVSVLCDEPGKVLITPSGMKYDVLCPDDIVAVGLDGQIWEANRRPSMETPLHLAIYRHRSDVRAIVHTHSTFATAAAVAGTPIPAVVEDMAQIVGGNAEVADYAPAGSAQLAENVISALGPRGAVLLANHGVVGVGADIEEALQVCQVVEKTACIYAYAKLFGNPKTISDKDVKEMNEFFKTKYKQKP
ncbi:MAG: class II aldolase/adducin family protein [Eubacteriales bacterium]